MSAIIDVAEIIAQTDAAKAPVRLEYVRGRTKWEASPASRHQKALQRIKRALRPIPGHPTGCACFALADTRDVATRTFNFPGDREMIRDRSAKMALTMLRYQLLGRKMPF